MSNNELTTREDGDYQAWVRDLKERYRQSQLVAATSVNRELLVFYWTLGRDIALLHAESRWGSSFYRTLSQDLQKEIPNVKGFSPRNLLYMKLFFELFPIRDEIAPQPVAQLTVGEGSSNGTNDGNQVPAAPIFSVPWSSIRVIIDKCSKDSEKAGFYVRETVAHGWSRAVLMNQIDGQLYERHGKAISNFPTTLPEPQSACAQELTRDPYQFDFLAIREDYDERELKDALLKNTADFLMELGTGFAFMGREYRLTVGQTEQWLDLLFYNTQLHCYVVVEVKTTEFEPAHIGQLGTYVAAVNHMLRREGDQPTIGLLICKTKDNVLAQYSVESSSQPIGVSEYNLSQVLPEDYRSSMPTIEEIERGLSDRGLGE